MKSAAPALRVSVALVFCLAVQGCGIKLVYNNADRLSRWWVSDYINLDKPQRQYFDASTRDLMYWHRTTQLAIYKDELLALATTIESGRLDEERLLEISEEVESWGIAFNTRITPIAIDILLALSTEQIDDFDQALDRSNKDYEKEAERNHEDRAKEEAKDYVWFLRRLVGRLTPQQRSLIVEKHLQMVPDAEPILMYRLDWQKKLLKALRADPRDSALIEDLIVNFDAHYTPEFARMVEFNEVIYQQLTLELLAGLNDKQRERLVEELRGYAEIFAELIVEAPPSPPPPPAPLPRYSNKS